MLCSSKTHTKRQWEYLSVVLYWENCFPITGNYSNRPTVHIMDQLGCISQILVGMVLESARTVSLQQFYAPKSFSVLN